MASVNTNGAAGRIRTYGDFRPGSFQDCRHKPLAHYSINGRDNRIRTCGPMLPKHVRYQTALYPDKSGYAAAQMTYPEEEPNNVELI